MFVYGVVSASTLLVAFLVTPAIIRQQHLQHQSASRAGTHGIVPNGSSDEFKNLQMGQGEQQVLSAADAEELIGVNVVAANGEKVGEIENFLIDSTDRVQQVVLELGGFLGLGKERIIVQREHVNFPHPPGDVVISATPQQVKDAILQRDTMESALLDDSLRPLR
jgi:sporulation protein YlmC with PRC-barrel domain